jgi:hypothetical protein
MTATNKLMKMNVSTMINTIKYKTKAPAES